MDSFSGIIRKPVVAAAAVSFILVSSDLPGKLFPPKSAGPSLEQPSFSPCNSVQEEKYPSWVSHVSVPKVSKLSWVTPIPLPLPDINFPMHSYLIGNFVPSLSYSHAVSSPILPSLYQSAEFHKAPKPTSYTYDDPTSPSKVLYKCHYPDLKACDVSCNSDCSLEKSRTVVVLLGWLGSQQKHLKKYAEWYTSRGFNAITFTLPMADIISYQVRGKAEESVDLLVNHLANWLDKQGKNLVFHTFSNTGWLIYGVILQKFQNQDPSLMGRIRGCIVDSAPVAAPDPQVWASGFSAALLKKHSVAVKGTLCSDGSGKMIVVGKQASMDLKPAISEAALLLVLEKFFKVVLNVPNINRKLSDVLGVLSSGQPSCPQLYIYSTADRVIPAGCVESFIEDQRRAGREVRACNFVSTPHVDHFRNDPKLYTSQLSQFIEDCLLTGCKGSS